MQVDGQSNLGYVPADGGPNLIGNAEDGPVLPDNGGAARQVLLHGANQHVRARDLR